MVDVARFTFRNHIGVQRGAFVACGFLFLNELLSNLRIQAMALFWSVMKSKKRTIHSVNRYFCIVILDKHWLHFKTGLLTLLACFCWVVIPIVHSCQVTFDWECELVTGESHDEERGEEEKNGESENPDDEVKKWSDDTINANDDLNQLDSDLVDRKMLWCDSDFSKGFLEPPENLD